MDTEFNYLYEDKYYENAVKNLKSTFYDVVEREEIMLNNLENRIAQETDDGVKATLLDLWSKQNDSLDQSIVLFRQLKQSVRVIDSFVQELSNIDKAIVSDIINSTNNIRTTRVQQMEQQDVMEQPVMEEQVQQYEQQPVMEEEYVPEEVVEEQVQEEPVVEEAVQEETTVVEEPTAIEEVQEVVEEQVQEEAPVVEEAVQEEATVVEEPTATEQTQEENSEEIKDVIDEEISMALPLIEFPEGDNPQETVESDSQVVEEAEDEIHFDESFNTKEVPEMEKVNEENDGMDLPNVVEADKIDFSAIDEEENKEKNTNEEIVEIPNNKNDEKTESNENIDKVAMSYVGKEDDDTPKAIIVTESQFEKLNNSLETQENKLYNRGYLSSEIINNTNYVLENSINSNNSEHDNQLDAMVSEDAYTIPDNPTREDMEGLIEKAAELYKTGKKHEAQALYEEISRINDEMHQDKGPELVKAA